MENFIKTLSIVLISCNLIYSNSFCQTTESQEEENKLRTFGIGININPDIFEDYFYDTPSQFLFTLNIKDKVRIEPEFGLSSLSRSHDDDYDSKSKNSTLLIGIGLYRLKSINQIHITYGIKFNRLSNNTENEGSSPTSRYERTSYGIGPSLGLEYFFSKHFSFGTGFSVIYMNRKTTIDYDINDNTIEETVKYKLWSTIAGLQFRLYF